MNFLQLLTLETFSHRFYKNLHDNTFVNEMQDHDVIVCFELPCHAQQSRSWKPDPDPSKNPLIIPVHLTKDTSFGHTSYARSGFAHPFVIVISHEDAHDKQRIYAAVIERLERWTENSRDLYQWEEEMVVDELRVSPNQIDSLVEIKENGDVIAVDVPEEGDIVDERSVIVTDESAGNAAVDGEPVIRRVGPKPDLFEIHIQRSSEKYVMGHSYSTYRNDKWNLRANDAETDASLLHENDALFCEWDDNFRTYYFGDDNKYEHGLWTEASWKEFVHPELTESREAANAKKGKGITLLDCLEEFTREEQLGEDDLWYCPRCKDHKQATKKFDIWTVPDILVVHLKRFSNSRILRDKIDAFVDFPVEGLDLGPFCVERQVAEKLAAEGANTEELGLRDLDEPLIYDLYAVDEHLGGLGGGHYRAYAKNHVNGKWYHFDDSYVTPAEAMEAVVSLPQIHHYALFSLVCIRMPMHTFFSIKDEQKGH
jgi:ubiquitin carboxyl-terminal hydrolase 4/11/15